MDFAKIDKKWQEYWENEKIFTPRERKGKKFFITVPYPYVSGPLHIGHGRSYVCGDVFAKYKLLKGYNVLFPMAFHITGTPVLAIAKSISNGDEKTINLFRRYVSLYVKDEKKINEIVESFKEPMNIYKFFSEKMKEDFKSIGLGIDWFREFNTGEPIYNRFVEWQYYKLNEKGYLVKGDYPITYCLSCQNAVGEDDIKDGDTNPVHIVDYTVLKFRLLDSGEYLLAATLRPETMFGQTNLWVNSDVTYDKIKVNDEIWIVSSECVVKLEYQGYKIEKIGKVLGKDLIGKKVVAPVIEREIPILSAKFCDPDVGTGIVTSVPSDAPYDYVALKELKGDKETLEKFSLVDEIEKIKPIPIIKTSLGELSAIKVVEENKITSQTDERLEELTNFVYKEGFHSGIMLSTCGKYAGMKASEAKEKMKDELLKEGKAIILYETSRKARCRCGGKIIVAKLKGQWFIDYNSPGWKNIARKCLNKMIIYPEKYRQMFEATFDWLDKRPCVRKRGLGTRFPFNREWIIESLSDSTIYPAFYTIAHILRKVDAAKLTPEVFDYVFLRKGKIEDVSKKSGILDGILKEMREEFEYWYPLDQRHTGVMHISNHLSFLIFHHVAIFSEKYWPRAFTLIEPVILEGAKISKSKGNVIPLCEIGERYGADLFRFYIVSKAEFGSKIDWREKEAADLRKHLLSFIDLVEDIAKANGKPKNDLASRWIVSRFNKNLQSVEKFIESFNLRKYSQTSFYDLMNDIAEFLSVSDDKMTLRSIVEKWLIILSPIVPHIAEELWRKLGNKDSIFKERWPLIDKNKIDEEAETAWDYVRNLIDDIKHIMKLVGRRPNEAYIITAEDWKWSALADVKRAKGNVKNVMKVYGKEFGEEGIKTVQTIVKRGLWKEDFVKIDESSVLKEMEKFIEEQTGLKVYINQKIKIEKAKLSLPLKPAIYVR